MGWKVLSLFVLYGIGLLKDITPEQLRNNKILKFALLVLMTGALVVGILSTVADNNKANITSKNYEQQLKVNDSLLTLEHNQSKIVDEINMKLEPFIKIARTKYPNTDIQTALDSLIKDYGITKKDLEVTKKELEVTKEMAKPNTISFHSRVLKRIGNDFHLTLLFKPAKNEPLGVLVFDVEIDTQFKAQILDIKPTSNSQACGMSGVETQILWNGKKAKISYTLLGGDYPGIFLKVSGPCHVKISGSRGLEPFVIDVK